MTLRCLPAPFRETFRRLAPGSPPSGPSGCFSHARMHTLFQKQAVLSGRHLAERRFFRSMLLANLESRRGRMPDGVVVCRVMRSNNANASRRALAFAAAPHGHRGQVDLASQACVSIRRATLSPTRSWHDCAITGLPTACTRGR